MANNWDEFFSAPVKASKKLHVTPRDIKFGEIVDANYARRRAEQPHTVPTGLPYGQTRAEDMPKEYDLRDPQQQVNAAVDGLLDVDPRTSRMLRDYKAGMRSVGDNPMASVIGSPVRTVRDAALTGLGMVNPVEWFGGYGWGDIRDSLQAREREGLGAEDLGREAGRSATVDTAVMAAMLPGMVGGLAQLGTGALNLGTKGLRALHQRLNAVPEARRLENISDINPSLSTFSGVTIDPARARRLAVGSALAGLGTAGYAPDAEAGSGELKKILQGVYRGYAGERRPTIGVGGSEMYFTAPQKRVADYYATRRAAESGEAPHVDMLMVDPFNTKYQSYPLGLPADKYNPSRDAVVTRARRVDPEEVVDTHQLYAGGGSVAGMVRRLAQRSMPMYTEGVVPSMSPLGALSVVKPKGGNWLNNSVEDALRGLKYEEPPIKGATRTAPEAYNNGASERVVWKAPDGSGVQVNEGPAGHFTRADMLDNWIEGPLTKYVKTRMASPDDEVRKLAEQGVLHVDPAQLPAGNRQVHHTGENLQKLSASPAALRWENASDYAIHPRPAFYYQDFGSSNMRGDPSWDWVHKLDPNAPLYAPYGKEISSDLGFPHLIDELSNALDPNSGLPQHLQLSPEAVKNMSMEKAVRRVADINAWRAAKKVEANRALAEQAALVREYPHSDAAPNPKGLRWVELKAGELPEGYELRNHPTYGENIYGPGDIPITPNGRDDPRYKALADQLKYEGDTMGHCVGGYCDDVISGRSRIFSLRDAKGEPHVTVEVTPKGAVFSDVAKYIGKDKAQELLDQGITLKEMIAGIPDFKYPVSISQIKGKQNRKPNDEYLPFVQDFVKNSPHGQPWNDVGDLHNTDLRRTLDAFNSEELKKIQEAGIEVPHYATMDDIMEIGNKVWPGQYGPLKYASGGSVGVPAAGWELLTDPTGSTEENKLSWDIFSGHNDAEQFEALA